MEDLRNNSILADVKDSLDYTPDEVDTEFDGNIIRKINTAIARLSQLGLGELGSFMVNNGSETWNDMLGEDYQFVYAFAVEFIEVSVNLAFDPPQSGALKAALDEEYKTAEFNVMTAIELHNIEKEAN